MWRGLMYKIRVWHNKEKQNKEKYYHYYEYLETLENSAIKFAEDIFMFDYVEKIMVINSLNNKMIFFRDKNLDS
jgi:glycine/serine hydroxymethyltransferase